MICAVWGRIAQFVALAMSIATIITMPDEIIEAGVKVQLVLFVVSVGVALVGVHLGLDTRAVLIKRNNAINSYERPHVMEALEGLFNDMEQTKAIIKKMSKSVDTKHVCKVVHARIERHVDIEQQVAARFLEIGLAEIHTHLDPVFKSLREVAALEDVSYENTVGSIDDAMRAVVLAIKIIKEASPL